MNLVPTSSRIAVALVLLFVVRVTPQQPERLGLATTRDGSLKGSVMHEITNMSELPATEVPLNVGRLLTVISVRGPDGRSLEFEQNVAVFTDSPRQQVTHVRIRLPQALEPGGQTRLTLEYGGYLVGYTETGSLYIQDRIHEDFSILREDAFAWPALGTLTRSVNWVAPRSDFDFVARMNVPDRFTVASGGTLVERTVQNGRATFVYASVAPVPFLNLPIAEFGMTERAGVRVYFLPEDSVGAQRVLERAVGGLALLESWFGPLGVEPDLAVMEIPDMWGSQASLTGGIIQTASAFKDVRYMSQLYHELTHLWNAPDTDRPSARWNEGLATYLSRRMAARLDSWDGMEKYAQDIVTGLLENAGRTPEVAAVPFGRYGEAGVTGLSYRVGFLMFYLLHGSLGDEAFDAAVGGHYQAHRETGGSFEDLLARLDAAADKDLTPFFRDWVHTTAWYDRLADGASLSELGPSSTYSP